MTLRIAAVSDIHGNLPALEAVLTDIARCHIAEWWKGSWHVEPRAVQYDFERSAKRAEANGFPRWAYTLRTGKVRPRYALP
jgi:hypothetical protein